VQLAHYLDVGLSDVPASISEYTTTDIAAACSVAGVKVVKGGKKMVSEAEHLGVVKAVLDSRYSWSNSCSKPVCRNVGVATARLVSRHCINSTGSKCWGNTLFKPQQHLICCGIVLLVSVSEVDCCRHCRCPYCSQALLSLVVTETGKASGATYIEFLWNC